MGERSAPAALCPALAVCLVGCVAGSSLAPRQLDVTFVDPDGVEWTAPDAEVELLKFTATECREGTWIDLSGGAPSLQAWFGYSSSGTLASESLLVRFGGTDDGTTARYLLGGSGSLVSNTETTLEYVLDDAQDCTHLGTDLAACVVQAAPVTILVEGDVGELGGDPNPGWPDGVDGSGAPVCGGEHPGG